MRRLLAPLMAASLLMLLPAVTAWATAAPGRAARGDCARVGYPIGHDAMVSVDTTGPSVGQQIQVTGSNYCPDEDVEIIIAGQHVGTAHTDGQGNFGAQPVTAPGPPGKERLRGVGARNVPSDRDGLTLQVLGPAPASSGGTAFTGVQIALFGVLALVLVVGGVVVTTLGRNRRPERA